ncbi:hypothetical protein Dsin_027953 [Dipteronia sinensis]|uniref:F-box associated beta-propeller type 3 domain-containing protein n=1 Tax=Dipteronia sinensis TaxID=43782 RepID=A0AAD9ZQV5_9ROSI|nr:hypothetical protein Dsin_027953 [Dipteronia sinensis]
MEDWFLRRILDSQGYDILSIVGSCNDGALHWVAYNPESQNLVIVAFDLVEENFKTLPLPITNDKRIRNRAYSFSLLGDSLCLFIEEGYQTLQLWIMKEYGVKESWINILTVEESMIVDFNKPPIFDYEMSDDDSESSENVVSDEYSSQGLTSCHHREGMMNLQNSRSNSVQPGENDADQPKAKKQLARWHVATYEQISWAFS